MVSAAGVVVSGITVILTVVVVAVLFYRFYFLRKPRRVIPKGDVICSPADGKIVRIIKIDQEGPLKIRKGLMGNVRLIAGDTVSKGYVIVIMMTPLNVHYQRSPVEGKVVSTRYSQGRFVNAMRDAKGLGTLENEKNEIVINNDKIGSVKVVQVAGFLARRIRCFVSARQKVHKGQEVGLICLGSQVILVMPDLKLEVSEGQKVVDGETVIARF